MSIGRMTERITVSAKVITTDAEGFAVETYQQVLTARASREGRHGSEAWRNRAAFTDATELFTIRKPSQTVDTSMIVQTEQGEEFEITSTEDVKSRGMYLEILCREVKSSGDV